MEVVANFAKTIQDENLSWISGTVPVSSSNATLFVKNGKEVAFPFPSATELQQLYDTAEPASFGRGSEAVLDPNYRSARTLLIENFAINLRPDHDLLSQIKRMMIKNEISQDFVRADLYRVNIYGPGDFFKEHKDTPQTGCGHFGSLVFCMPTKFQGGAFIIRSPNGEEIKFDWGAKYSPTEAANEAVPITESPANKKIKIESNSPSVEFLAFASDLAHWIEPVTAGYRVTVTFHLFLETRTAPLLSSVAYPPTTSYEEIMKKVIAVKASNKFAGKNILFPLIHEYSARKSTDIVLKGGDAALWQMLSKLDVKLKLMYYYDYEENKVHYGSWCDPCNSSDDDEDNIGTTVCYLTPNVCISSMNGCEEDDKPIEDLAQRHRVLWARSPILPSMSLSVTGSYGNHPSMEVYEGNICIMTTW